MEHSPLEGETPLLRGTTFTPQRMPYTQGQLDAAKVYYTLNWQELYSEIM